MKKLCVFLVASVMGVMAMAQSEKVWTLQECVDYASLNNNDLKIKQLSEKESEVNVKQAKGTWLPTMNASVRQNYGNQPYGTPEHRYTGSYGMDANWKLWDASRSNDIASAKGAYEQSKMEVKVLMNSIVERIMKVYTQILYDDESVKVNEELLKSIEDEANRSKELFRAGSIAVADYAQMESEVSSQRYSLTSVRNTSRTDRMELCLLMDMEPDWEMKVDSVSVKDGLLEAPLPSWEEVWTKAKATRPEMRSAMVSTKNAEIKVKSAKGGYLPSVSVGANVGTSNMEKSEESFGSQLKNNWSNSVGLSVSVPILSGRQTRSQVEKAKIALENAKINARSTEDDLRHTVQGYWLDAVNAQESYLAAKDKLKSARTSHELVSEQFEVGLKTPTDLLTSHARLLEAEQQLLKAKYTAYYNVNMLRFYAGEPVE